MAVGTSLTYRCVLSCACYGKNLVVTLNFIFSSVKKLGTTCNHKTVQWILVTSSLQLAKYKLRNLIDELDVNPLNPSLSQYTIYCEKTEH